MKNTLFNLSLTLFFAGAVCAQSNCNTIHAGVTCPAEFPGGKPALHDWLLLNRNYFPESKKEMVGVMFCIDTTGKPQNIHFLKARQDGGALTAAEKEALRLMGDMPLWQPAKGGANCTVKVCEEVIVPFVFYPQDMD